MRRTIIKRVLFVVILLSFYVVAKSIGLWGRQFYAGSNTHRALDFQQIGDTLTLEVERSRRGITRYGISPVQDEPSKRETAAFDLRVEERICGGAIFDSHIISFKQAPNWITVNNSFGGQVVKPPLAQRQDSVCLDVTLEKLQTGSNDIPVINLWVRNTRPCWLIECLLD